MPADVSPPAPIEIDIISDVMCPWCIIGFRQLEQALSASDMGAYIRWHPFELNPSMPPEGQNLAEHIAEKYGVTPEQSALNRAHLQSICADLGIAFKFDGHSRIVNTFAAHQLLDWAQTQNLQHPLKMALFDSHFTKGLDVSRHDVLVDIAATVGLDPAEATEVLTSARLATDTRARQRFWAEHGITGVPAMVFEGKYVLTGAQGSQNYVQTIQKVLAEQAPIEGADAPFPMPPMGQKQPHD